MPYARGDQTETVEWGGGGKLRHYYNLRSHGILSQMKELKVPLNSSAIHCTAID